MFNIILMIFLLLFFSSCNSSNKYDIAVWWWDSSLNAETYLTFAQKNNITSIFYCDSSLNQSTSYFINHANKKNIDVYLLAGEYQWLTNSSNLYDLIDRYNQYQINFSKQKFAGIHLDIEPHQDVNFDNPQVRQSLITNLISLCYNLNQTYPDIYFGYDIPFWLDDEICFNNQILPAYAHMINYADNITIMAYRDCAQDIYNCAFDEIEYAKSINKNLTIGVETKSSEGDKVSFMEEGKAFMNRELEKLKLMLPSNFKIAIHNIKDWYDMKN